jgi:hypothetical protein
LELKLYIVFINWTENFGKFNTLSISAAKIKRWGTNEHPS